VCESTQEFVVVEPTPTRFVRKVLETQHNGTTIVGEVSKQPNPRNPRYDRVCLGSLAVNMASNHLAQGATDRVIPAEFVNSSPSEWWEQLPPRLWGRKPDEFVGYAIKFVVGDGYYLADYCDAVHPVVGAMFVHKATAMAELKAYAWTYHFENYLKSLIEHELDLLNQWLSKEVWQYAITLEETDGSKRVLAQDTDYYDEQRACVAMMQDFQKYLGGENE